jgi:8-oxo-dGTP pyrophosphatase MutT (NUDIX family)
MIKLYGLLAFVVNQSKKGEGMRYETSAGGVVLFGNAILLLKKYNGDWVLPKGKVEPDETIRDTALREVSEESGVKAEIDRYLGAIHYVYQASYARNESIYKTVHWFLMQSRTMRCFPQKNEGFVEARFVHIDRVLDMVKYPDERRMVQKGLEYLDDAGH